MLLLAILIQVRVLIIALNCTRKCVINTIYYAGGAYFYNSRQHNYKCGILFVGELNIYVQSLKWPPRDLMNTHVHTDTFYLELDIIVYV